MGIYTTTKRTAKNKNEKINKNPIHNSAGSPPATGV